MWWRKRSKNCFPGFLANWVLPCRLEPARQKSVKAKNQPDKALRRCIYVSWNRETSRCTSHTCQPMCLRGLANGFETDSFASMEKNLPSMDGFETDSFASMSMETICHIASTYFMLLCCSVLQCVASKGASNCWAEFWYVDKVLEIFLKFCATICNWLYDLQSCREWQCYRFKSMSLIRQWEHVAQLTFENLCPGITIFLSPINLRVNPMGRILVRRQGFRNNLKILCQPFYNWLYDFPYWNLKFLQWGRTSVYTEM